VSIINSARLPVAARRSGTDLGSQHAA